LGAQSASQFALVESAVVITIELVEKGAPCLLDLVKIEGAVVVGVEFLYRAWASRLAEGRQAGAKHATANQDIQQCCASRYQLDILLGLTRVAGCCAFAASGQAAAPPSSVMTTRRPMETGNVSPSCEAVYLVNDTTDVLYKRTMRIPLRFEHSLHG